MAKICKPCATGDHGDCPRWLVRDHPCTCVCDDAPRQLGLWPAYGEPPVPAGKKRAGGAGHNEDEEVPW